MQAFGSLRVEEQREARPHNPLEARKEFAKQPLRIYIFASLILLVIGFAVLGAPLVRAYLEGGRYDAGKLDFADQKLALLHEALWRDLRKSWQQFWISRVQSHLARLRAFLAQEGLEDAERAAEDALDYYWVDDETGQPEANLQPFYEFDEFSTMNLAANFCRNLFPNLSNALVELNIFEMEVILTILCGDAKPLRLNMGGIAGHLQSFFARFESRLKQQPPQTVLLALDGKDTSGRSLRSYGGDVESSSVWNSLNRAQKNDIYTVLAQSILR